MLALYAGTFHYPRVFDDLTYVPSVGAGLHRWLADETFRWIGPHLAAERLANVVLHGATAIVLFGFLQRLFRAVLADARGMAFFGALAFALHPVAVYGVAYLTQRSIIMATLFSIAALWCVLEGLLRQFLRWHLAAAALYFLAVISKEHAVMLPAVAVAMALLLRGTPLYQLRYVLILMALAAAATVYRARTLIGSAYEPFAQDIGALAYSLSIINQGYLFFRYLVTWLIPCPCWMSIDLRVGFPHELLAWPQTLGFIGFLAYPIVAFLLLRRRGAMGLAGLGLLYPWLLALTEFATIRAQEPFVLYRSYLWMSGLPIALPALLPAKGRPALLIVGCLVLAVLARERIETFSDPLKLWDDAVRKNTDLRAPYVERAYINRGELHRGAGRASLALADFDRAIALNPRIAEGYVGRATLRLELRQPHEALPDLQRAVELEPNHASARAKRCYAKSQMAYPAADVLADCEAARKLAPADPEIRDIDAAVRRRLGVTSR
ncbi:MAG TPA: hypothetical protein VM183_18280 [Burkholderiales bacterium]|nr:hypothetical protein [Burkholderiales bacterium]